MSSRDASPSRSDQHFEWDVENRFVEPEEWRAGHCLGTIYPYRRGIRLRITVDRILKLSRYFSFDSYDTQDNARTAATVVQYQYCIDNGLVRNMIRLIAPDVYEMQLTRGDTTIFSSQDLETVSPNRWYSHRQTKYHRYAKTYAHGIDRPIHWMLYQQQCDHLNGNTLDNRRDNLQPCSQAENTRNACLLKTNTSGMTGVSRLIVGGRSRWYTQWRENGVSRTRYFAVAKFGEEEARRRAIQCRQQADQRTGCVNGRRPKLIND